MFQSLPLRIDQAAARRPDHVAIEEGSSTATITYAGLKALSDRVRDRLVQQGVQRGDRVGLCVRKSIDTVASLIGAMKAGAAYVPVDPSAPAYRSAYILADCKVKVLVAEAKLLEALKPELDKAGHMPALIVLEGDLGGASLAQALDGLDAAGKAPATATVQGAEEDIAYILYTSGSTGKPKGVVLTQRNAVSFVDWCISIFPPNDADRFSSHAPLHFDLSILDLYVPLTKGATLILIGNEAGKEPLGLAQLIADRKITVWYSAPSILSMLAQYGKLEKHDYGALRVVLFAGEVFPVKYLRLLQGFWPRPRYLNLYGPTETNVCTYYEVKGKVPEEKQDPYPIGIVCENLRGRVVDENGRDVPKGSEGELVINGPNVMREYWNLPERTAQGFLVDGQGEKWYKTGDIVVLDGNGDYVFMGRRDRMVKRRGNRVELGEVEAGLYRHPEVKEAAVVALKDADAGVRIRAFLNYKTRPLSIIELKKFCTENLPAAMIPDDFVHRDPLPKTSTDKVDYQRLLETA